MLWLTTCLISIFKEHQAIAQCVGSWYNQHFPTLWVETPGRLLYLITWFQGAHRHAIDKSSKHWPRCIYYSHSEASAKYSFLSQSSTHCQWQPRHLSDLSKCIILELSPYTFPIYNWLMLFKLFMSTFYKPGTRPGNYKAGGGGHDKWYCKGEQETTLHWGAKCEQKPVMFREQETVLGMQERTWFIPRTESFSPQLHLDGW